MRWLLFLSRLAFICGICFLVSLVLRMIKEEINDVFSSTVIITGFLMGVVIVPVTIICYLVVMLSGKKLSATVPRWLVITNIFFLFVFLFYLFYVNDPYYNQ